MNHAASTPSTLLCLDLGTSGAKVALVDLTGRTVASASRGYPTHTTSDGGAEQNPEEWLRAAREAIGEVRQGVETTRPVALALTGQMQDLVLLPQPGTPQYPAVLYSDTRAAQEAEQIRAQLAEQGATWDVLTGNQQDATSCAAMFRRMSRFQSEQVDQAEAVVFGPAAYLAVQLGCGAWCDMTTASTTGLLDIETRRWSGEVASAAGMDSRLLPRLTSSAAQVLGETDGQAARMLGLPPGIPVVLGPGDAAATTAGIIGLEPGESYAYLGSSGWVASIVQETPSHADVTGEEQPRLDASHRLLLETNSDERRSLRISALLAAGSAADWAREAFLHGVDAMRANQLLEARCAEKGRGPTDLLALPSIAGERYPVRDASLRAAIVGMDAHTRGLDIYAAVLEGVAFAVAHALAENGSPTRSPLAVTGGGAASTPWLRILADATGRDVRVVPDADAALRGVSLLAADALGLDHEMVPLTREFSGASVVEHPDRTAVAEYAGRRAAHRALYDAARGVHEMLNRRREL